MCVSLWEIQKEDFDLYTPGARRNCFLTRTTTKSLICDGPPIEILKQPSLYLDSRAFHLVLAGLDCKQQVFLLTQYCSDRRCLQQGVKLKTMEYLFVWEPLKLSSLSTSGAPQVVCRRGCAWLTKRSWQPEEPQSFLFFLSHPFFANCPDFSLPTPPFCILMYQRGS